MIISPGKTTVKEFHALLLGAVAPRPIALASTMDGAGHVNLSPFSFFNAFSTQPPILVFSPSRRVRDNTTKHTLDNILETREVVINVVSHAIVQQVSLASTEYEKGVNEFVKAGFHAEKSILVKPPRVGESPVSFECKVSEVIPLGDKGGAGNLVICEVVMAHAHEHIFGAHGRIDPNKIDLVARMGGDFYCRASGAAVFEVPRPIDRIGIGIDQFPEKVRTSPVLTGNQLGRLAGIEKLPDLEAVEAFTRSPDMAFLLQAGGEERTVKIHAFAGRLIEEGDLVKAWMALLADKDQ